jgi:hypothetical protein
VVREKEKADKAAERQRQKEERDSAKALQLSQKGKRQALQGSQIRTSVRNNVVVVQLSLKSNLSHLPHQ